MNIETVKLADAPELIDYLRPSASHWGPANQRHAWIYRGQWTDWPLRPSAWRDCDCARRYLEPIRVKLKELAWQWYERMGTRFASQKGVDVDVGREWALQVLVERDVSRRFFSLADELGLHLPETGELSKPFELHLLGNLVPNSYYSCAVTPCAGLALAQHHGVPTRLIDWTMNPLVAAYFAAAPLVDALDLNDDHPLVVYAIKLPLHREYRLRMLRVPRSENHFLHSQAGLFLWDCGADRHFVETGEWPTLEETIQHDVDNRVPVQMRKIYCRASDTERLLGLLSQESITAAHLQPTYSTVAKTIEYQARTLEESCADLMIL